MPLNNIPQKYTAVHGSRKCCSEWLVVAYEKLCKSWYVESPYSVELIIEPQVKYTALSKASHFNQLCYAPSVRQVIDIQWTFFAFEFILRNTSTRFLTEKYTFFIRFFRSGTETFLSFLRFQKLEVKLSEGSQLNVHRIL